jgi:hypothetical protein
MRDTDVAARIPFFGKLAGEELVQLGTENTIRDELALFADLSGHVWGRWKGTVNWVVLAPAISHVI